MARIVSQKTGSNRMAKNETRKRRAGILAAAVAGVGLYAAPSFAANGTWIGGPFPPPSYAPMTSYSGDYFGSNSKWKSGTVANGNSTTGAIADFSTLEVPFDPVYSATNYYYDSNGNPSPAVVYLYSWDPTVYLSNLHFGSVVDHGAQWAIGDNPYYPSVATGTIQLVGPSLITVDNSLAWVYCKVAGTSGLTKEGEGDLQLTKANTFTGDITINNGRMIVGNDTQLGGSANLGKVVLNNDGQLLFNNDMNSGRDFVVNGDATGVGTVIPPAGGAPSDMQFGASFNTTSKLYDKGSITGPGTLNIVGNGRVWMGITASNGGGIVVNGGTLALVENGKVATTTPLTVLNGTLELRADGKYRGGTDIIATANFLGGTSQTVGTGFTHDIILSDANSKISVNATSNASSYYVTVGVPNNPSAAPVISGTGTLNKVGPGTLVLNSTNHTYSGGTVISEGTLMLRNPISAGAPAWPVASATGTGDVRVVGGVLTSGAGLYGSIGGKVFLSGGTISPGGDGAPGQMDMNGLTTGFGSIKFDVGASSDTLYVGPGGLTLLGGTFDFSNQASIATNSGGYTIINYNAGGAGTLIGSTGTLQVTGIPSNRFGTLITDTGNRLIKLKVDNINPTQVWKGTTDVNWDLATGNWDAGIAYTQNNQAMFDDTSSRKAVTVNAMVTPQWMYVNNSSGNDYTIASTTLANISGYTGLTKTGTGALTLSGPNSFTGNVLISKGKISTDTLANQGVNSPLGAGSLVAFGDSSSTFDMIKTSSPFSYSGNSTNNNLASSLYPTAWLTYTGSGAASTDRLFQVNPSGGTLDLRGKTLDMTGLANLAGNGYLFVTNSAYSASNLNSISQLRLWGDNSRFTGVLVIAPPEGIVNTGNPVTWKQSLSILSLMTPQSIGNGIIDLLGVPGFDNTELGGISTSHGHPAFASAVIEIGADLSPGTQYDFAVPLLRNYFNASNAASNANKFLGSVGQLRLLGANNNTSVGFAAINTTPLNRLRVVNIPIYTGSSYTNPGAPQYSATLVSKTQGGLPNGGGDGWVFGSPSADGQIVFMNGIDLANSDPRFMRTIRGVGTLPEVMLTGMLSNSGTRIRIAGTGGMVLNNGGAAGVYANGTTGTISPMDFTSGGLFVGSDDVATAGIASPLGNNNYNLTIGGTIGNIGATNYNYGPGNINTGLYTYGTNAGITATPSITISRNLTIGTGASGTLSIGGFTADHTAFAGQINMNGVAATFAAETGGQVDFTGEVYGAGSLRIGPAAVEGTGTSLTSTTGIVVGATSANGGSGLVVFTGSNTYTGGTTVQDGGILMVNNVVGSGTGTGSVLVNAGGLLGGTGTVGAQTTIQNGGVLAPHGVGSTPSTLHFSTVLGFDAGGIYSPLVWNSAMSDQANVDQQLVDNGMIVRPTYAPDFAPNVGDIYTLFTANTFEGIDDTKPLPTFSNAGDARFTATLGYDKTTDTAHPTITAVFGWAAGQVNWTGSVANNTWDNTGAQLNWSGATYADPNRVRFEDTGANNLPVVTSTVNLGSDVTPLDVQFNNSVLDYTVNGGAFKMIDPMITNPAGGSTQAHVGITKDGTGKVTLNLHNSLTGSTLIKNGTLAVAFNDTLPTGLVTIDNGKLEVLSGYVDPRSYNLTSANAAIAVDSGTQTIGGTIGGTGALNFTGPGTLALANTANTYSGGTVINSGAIQVNASGQLGTGHLTIGNASLQVTGNIVSPRDVTLTNANAAIVVNSGVTYRNGGVFDGTGGGTLNVSGGGTVNLAGNNLYTGGTNVSGGSTLMATNLLGSATGSGAVNMTSGTTLRGTGVVGGVVNATGATVSPGTDSATGILAVGGLNADTTTNLNFRIGSFSDRLNVLNNNAYIVNGALPANSNMTFNMTPAAGVTPGVIYTLLDYAGTGLSAAQFASLRFNLLSGVPTTNMNFVPVNDSAATSIDVRVDSTATVQRWGNTGASGNWDYGTTNWNYPPATTPVVYNNANQVLIDNTAGGTNPTVTINLTANVAPQFIQVDNAAGKNYVIQTNPGIINGHTGLLKTNTGRLTMIGDQTFDGAVSVRDGNLWTSKITSSGIPSPIGAGSAVYLGGPATTGTLTYTGSIQAVSNRSFNFGNAGGTIFTNNSITNSVGTPIPTLRLTGGVYGGSLNKNGPGWLQIASQVNLLNQAGFVRGGGTLDFTNTAVGSGGNRIAGYFSVEDGSTVKGPQNSLGSAEIRLVNGTLNLYGSPAYAGNALALDIWTRPGNSVSNLNGANGGVNPNFFPGNLNSFISSLGAPTKSVNTTNVTSGLPPTTFNWDNNAGGNAAMFANYGVTNTTDYYARWSGLMNITTPGKYSFATRSDDGSLLYVDGQLVAANNYFQGMNTRGGSISLTPGQHNILVYYYQGNGGQGMDAYWTPPGGTQVNIPMSIFSVNPTADYGDARVWVQGDSTLQMNGILQARVGTNLSAGTPALKMDPGFVFTVNNDTAGGSVSFGSTQLNGAGNFDIAAQGSIGLGSLSNVNSANVSTVNVNNSAGYTGDVTVDGASSTALAAGSNFHVYAGRLIGLGSSLAGSTNPLGGASVTLEPGTTLALGSSNGATPAAVFDDAVSLVGSGTIQHITDAVTSTLGSAGKGVSIGAGGTLTFDIQAGTLNVAGPITGGVGITKIGGGTVVANAVTVPLSINAGTVRVGTNDGYSLKTMPVVMLPGATFDAGNVKQTLTGNQILPDGAILNAASNVGATPAGYFDLTGNLTASNVNGSGTAAQITSSGTGANPGYLRLGDSSSPVRNITTDVDLSVSAGIASAKGFNKLGAATMTIAGNSNSLLSGAINVQNGTLAVAGANALGSADVNMAAGTTMQLSSGARYVPGLYESRLANTGSVDRTTIPNPGFNSDFSNFTSGIRPLPEAGVTTFTPWNVMGWGQNTTYVYRGQIYVGNNNGNGTGTLAFAESIDDQSYIAIDGNQVMYDTGSTTTTTGPMTLSTGWHDIDIRFMNGGGGAGPWATLGWQNWWGFGMNTTLPIPAATILPVQPDYTVPVDPGNMSLFRVLAPTNGSYAGGAGGTNNVSVAGSSTIDLSSTDFGSISTLGMLTRPAANTLTVNGPTRQVNFLGGLQLNTSGVVGFAGDGNVSVGQILSHASFTPTITKSGAGSLILDNVNNDLTGVGFNIQGGRLVAMANGAASPIDNATGTPTIALSGAGATLTLGNTSFATAADFKNPLTITGANAAIEHISNTTDTLSGAATLTSNASLRLLAGNVNLTGAYTGGGTLTKTGAGTLTVGGASSNAIGMVADGGTVQLNKASSVSGNLSVKSGTVTLGNASAIAANTALTMSGGTLNIDGYTPGFGQATLKGGVITGAGGAFAPSSIIANTPGSATSINTKFTSTGFTVDGGALTLSNTQTGGNANSITGTIIVQNGGMLGFDAGTAIGGSNPLGTAAVNLNGGTAGATLSFAGFNGVTPGTGLQVQLFTTTPPNPHNAFGSFNSFQSYFNALTPNLVANTTDTGSTAGAYPNNNYGGSAAANGFAQFGYNTLTNFQARFVGFIQIAGTGNQTFYTRSDDGSMIFIDGQTIVNNNYFQGATTRTGTFNNTVANSYHQIVVGYYQGTGGFGLEFGPGGTAGTYLNNSILGLPAAVVPNTVNATGNARLLLSNAGANITTLNLGSTAGPTTLTITGAAFPFYADNVTLLGNSSIFADANTVVNLPSTSASGINFGSYNLTKDGSGTMVANGTAVGGATSVVNVLDGTLIMKSADALGAGGFTGGRTGTIAPAGTDGLPVLDVQAANVNLSGLNVLGLGKLRISNATQTGAMPTNPMTGTFEINNFNTTSTFPAINLGFGSTLSMIQNADRTIASPINVSGPTYVSKSAGNNLTFDSVVNASGNGGLWMRNNGGGGTFYFRNTVNVGATGQFIVESGTTVLTNNGSTSQGSVNGQIKVMNGVLQANNTGIAGNRLPDSSSSPVTLMGGTLQHLAPLTGTYGNVTTETIGAVQVYGQGALQASISATTGANNNVSSMLINNLVRPDYRSGASFNLTAGAPTAGAGGTVVFTGDNLGAADGTNRGIIRVTKLNNVSVTPGAMIGGWATVGNDFATVATDGAYTVVQAMDPIGNTPLSEILDNGSTGLENIKETVSGTKTFTAGVTDVPVNSMNLNLTGGTTLNIGNHNLKIGTGGFIIGSTGNQSLTVQNGTITAGGAVVAGNYADKANGELTFWTNAGSSLSHVTSQITDNSAGPVAVVIAGNGQIEIQNTANSFTGGVFIGNGGTAGAGFFRIASTSSSKRLNTIGTNPIYFMSPTTLQVRANGSGSNVNIAGDGWGVNDIYMHSDGTVNVDRWDANSGNTVPFQDVYMDAGRTLSVTSGNSYSLQIRNLTMAGDATLNPTGTTLRITGAVGGSANGSLLTINGNSTVYLTSPSAASAMNATEVVVNSGTLNLSNAAALNNTSGMVVPTYINSGAKLTVPTSGSANFTNLNLRPGSILRIEGNTASTITGLMPVSTVEVGGNVDTNFNSINGGSQGIPVAAGGVVRAGGSYTYNSNFNLLGPVSFDTTSGNLTLGQPIMGGNNVSVSKVGTSSNPVNMLYLNGANATYGGGTSVTSNYLVANATGALGTGPVTVSGAGLELRAPQAAQNDVTMSSGQVAYMANNAVGDHSVISASGNINTGAQIVIFSNVTDFGNDSFVVPAWNVLSADSTRMRLLEGHYAAAANAVLAYQDSPTYIPQNLPTRSVFLGAGNDMSFPNTVVGDNTPWRGISTDAALLVGGTRERSLFGGTVLMNNDAGAASSPVELQPLGGWDLRLSGTALHTTNPAGAQVQVNINGNGASNRVVLQGTSPFVGNADYSGVSKFFVTSGATLEAGGYGYAQGIETAGSGTGKLIEVGPVGTLDIGGAANGMALNGPVLLDSGEGDSTPTAGGTLLINDAQNINGTGFVTAQPNSAIFIQNQSSALANKFGNGIFTQPSNLKASAGVIGYVVRMGINDIQYLNQLSTHAVYEVQGGDRSQDSAGLPILSYATTTYGPGNAWTAPGGVMTNDGSGRTFVSTGTGFNDSNLTGPSGGAAMFAATSGQTFNVAADVNTSKTLLIGSLNPIDGYNKSGSVGFRGKALDGPAGTTPTANGKFHAAALIWPTGNLGFSNWNSTLDTTLTIPVGQGSVLYLGAGGITDGSGYLGNRLAGYDIRGTTAGQTMFAPNIIIDGNSSSTSRVEMGFRDEITPFKSATGGRIQVIQPFTISGDVNSSDKRKFWISRRQGGSILGIDMNDLTMLNNSVLAIQEDNTDVRVSMKLAGALATITQNSTIDLKDVTLAPGNAGPSTLNIGRTSEGNLNASVYGTIAAGVTLKNIKGQLFFQDGSALNGIVDASSAPSGGDSWVQVHNGQDGTPAKRLAYSATGKIVLGRSQQSGAEDMNLYVNEGATSLVNVLGTRVDVVQGNGTTSNNGDDDATIRSSINGSAGAVRGAVLYNEVHLGNSTLSGNNMGLVMEQQNSESLLANIILDTPAGNATSQLRTINGDTSAIVAVGNVGETSTAGSGNILQVGYGTMARVYMAGALSGKAYVKDNAANSNLIGAVTVGGTPLSTGFALGANTTFEVNGGTTTWQGAGSNGVASWAAAAPTTTGNLKVTSGTFNIGGNNIGTAAVNVTGGAMNATSGATIGGTVAVSGGTITAATATFSGAVTQSGGTMTATGSNFNAAVTQTGGTHNSTSTYNQALTVSGSGILRADTGSAVGTITAKNGLTLSGGGTYAMIPSGSAGTYLFPLINVTTGGNLALGGTSKWSIDTTTRITDGPSLASPNAFWRTAHSWKILDVTGPATNNLNTNFSAATGTVAWNNWGFRTRTVTSGDDTGDVFLDFLFTGSNQWAKDGGGSWADAANNWTGLTLPDGTNAQFMGFAVADQGLKTAANAPATVTLDGSRFVTGLTFDNAITNTTGADLVDSYILARAGGDTTSTLTLVNGGGTATVDILHGTQKIAVPVIMTDSTNINIATGSALTIGNGTPGTVTTTVAAGKTLALNPTVANTGTMALDVLSLNDGSAFAINSGSATANSIVSGSSSLNVTGAASSLVATTVTVNAAKTLTKTGPGALTVGTMTLADTAGFTLSSGNATVTTMNSGSSNINVATGSQLSGAVIVAAGKAAVVNAGGAGNLALSNLTLSDNAASFEVKGGKATTTSGVAGFAVAPGAGVKVSGGEFNATGAITAPVTVSGTGTFSGASTVAGLVTGTGGLISVNNGAALTAQAGLNLNAGGSFQFKPTASASNPEVLSFGTVNLTGGDLVLGGTSSLAFDFSSLTAGQLPQAGDSLWTSAQIWKLIDVNGGTNTTGATFGSLANAGSYTGWGFSTSVGTGVDAGDIFLNWASLFNEWKAGDGTFGTGTNWSGGTAPAATDVANFRGLNVASGPVTVTLAAARSVSGVNFDPAHYGSTASYTLSNGGTPANTLTLANGGAQTNGITVASGSHQISAAVVISDSTDVSIPSAASTLTLGGVQVNSGRTLKQTAASAGTMALDTLSMADGSAKLEVSGGKVTANAVTGGNVTVHNGASLKLTQKGAVGTKGVASNVASLNLDGSIGAWQGQVDVANNSLAIAGNAPTDLTRVNSQVAQGYAGGAWSGQGIVTSSAAGQTTLGVAISGANVLVKYTYIGDTNLDGVVNGSDFANMKTGYSLQGSLGRPVAFSDGDLNFDGLINGSDFAMAKTAYSLQGSPLAMSAPHNVVVPEPSTLGLLALGAVGLLARRRRSSRKA